MRVRLFVECCFLGGSADFDFPCYVCLFLPYRIISTVLLFSFFLCTDFRWCDDHFVSGARVGFVCQVPFYRVMYQMWCVFFFVVWVKFILFTCGHALVRIRKARKNAFLYCRIFSSILFHLREKMTWRRFCILARVNKRLKENFLFFSFIWDVRKSCGKSVWNSSSSPLCYSHVSVC